MEGLEGPQVRRRPARQGGGGMGEDVGQDTADLGSENRTRSRSARLAHEAVSRPVVLQTAAVQSPAARRAAVEGWVQAVKPQQPGLEIAHDEPGVGPFFDGPHDGQRQAVDPVLGFTLGREGVEELGTAREKQRGVEPALPDPERGVEKLGLSEPEKLGALAPVETDADLGKRLEGGLVSRSSASRSPGHRAHFAPLPREENDHLARFAQLVAP